MPAIERRRALLDVARTEFARNGYSATTTLAIAERAGVSEGLVLKHFGTKRELFRAAVADPVLDLVRVHIANAERDRPVSPPTLAERAEQLRDFLRSFAQLIREQAPLLLAVVANLQEFPDIAAELVLLMGQMVEEASATLAHICGNSPAFREFDYEAASYAGLAATTAAALVGNEPTDFVDGFVDLMLFGGLSTTGRRSLRPG